MDSPSLELVLTDAAGIAQPLPAELGPLPLYRHDNGYCSVVGPHLSYAIPDDGQASGSASNNLVHDCTNIPTTLTPPRHKVFCGSKCSGNRSAPLPLHAYPSHRLTRRSGPHTCSRRSFTCNALDCTRTAPFKTKQALNRHYEVVHLAQRFDCPVPGCENVGENGIKRYDNLVAHMRNKHGVSPAGGSGGN
ncbi:hypothetical protein C7212DRAFT_344604 [Tuber magnatum]|uniref:C2H2-type domain-containing protein n=1 Tax=Tuber magnatum TaxID=42249 RepID=A0A317SNY2_9PEZI|nr:hypothetical protein C7212DRAFT_344604 [Tuber magnatum]